MKVNILILENIKKDREILRNRIECFFSHYEIDISIDIEQDPDKVLDKILKYDFLFLDIELGEHNGLDIGMKVKNKNKFCHIIITSKYKQYLIDGYDINAKRYLLKPISQEYFNMKMRGVLQDYYSSNLTFYDSKISENRIYYSKIVYVDYYNKYSYLIMENGLKLKSPYPLHYWNDFLKQFSFVQCYKSIIVNCDYVLSCNKDMIELETGEKIPVSRKYKSAFKEKWLESLQKSL